MKQYTSSGAVSGQRSGLIVMLKLAGLVKPLTPYMIAAITLGLFGHLAAAFITILGGYGILNLLGVSGTPGLAVIFVCLTVFAIARGILRYGEQTCNHFIAFKLLALIRSRVFSALRRLCPAKLEGRDKGDLISVITSDIELLEVFYAHTISPIAIAVLFSVVMVLYIGSWHMALGLVAFLSYLLVGLAVPLIISRISGDVGIRFRQGAGELSGFVLDSMRGLSETQQYGCGRKRLEEMNLRTDALSKDEERMKRDTGINMAVTNTIILILDLSMVLTASWLYLEGQVAFEGVLLATLALMGSFGPCVALANLGSTLQNTFAAGNRVLDILEESPAVTETEGRTPVEFTGAAADSVTFAYGNEEILKDISLEIPQGSVVGITGRSGSGKSTLLKLFMRFWDVKKGSVKLSGRKVADINTANLRDMESFMEQDTHLFHDSIRNNLQIAKLDATEEEIMEACRKASIHDFIMSLPQGYDTPAGELGDMLSGGERQRIGLARAFLHDAPFMLLDEPTSNLDSLNEAVILKALREEHGDKTVVLVSHRKSTMKIADRMYSAENGRMS